MTDGNFCANIKYRVKMLYLRFSATMLQHTCIIYILYFIERGEHYIFAMLYFQEVLISFTHKSVVN